MLSLRTFIFLAILLPVRSGKNLRIGDIKIMADMKFKKTLLLLHTISTPYRLKSRLYIVTLLI